MRYIIECVTTKKIIAKFENEHDRDMCLSTFIEAYEDEDYEFEGREVE